MDERVRPWFQPDFLTALITRLECQFNCPQQLPQCSSGSVFKMLCKTNSPLALCSSGDFFGPHFLKTEVLAEPLLFCPDAGPARRLRIVLLNLPCHKVWLAFTRTSNTRSVVANSIRGTPCSLSLRHEKCKA